VTGAEPPDYADRNVGQLVASAGFAALVVAPGLIGTFDAAQAVGRDETSLVAHALALQGQSPLGHMAADIVALLHWLEEQPEVDSSRIGLLGHSLGGHVALHAALAFDRPLPTVLASCAGSYRTVYGRDLNGGGAMALHGMLRYADLPDLMAALAPVPLMVQHGLRDEQFPAADAQAALSTVSAAYAQLGAQRHLHGELLPMGHGTDTARAITFFDRAFADSVAPLPRAVPPMRVVIDSRAREEAIENIDRAMFSGMLTLGPVGTAFEKQAARQIGAPHVIGVNSGTSAIEVALRIVGVAGRRVVIPANTFFATASAALAAGGRVEFIDSEPVGLGMCPRALARTVERHDDIAAVVVVHIGGIVSPYVREIAEICKAGGIALIEDAAHALGSTLDGCSAGSFGRMATFSLYPTKIITSGEGGLVVAHSAGDAAMARSLRDHGKVDFHTNTHARVGSNWRLSEVHAAIGLAHMAQLPDFVQERRNLAARYDVLLARLPQLRPVSEPLGVRGNYYKYIALLDPRIDRGRLKQALRARHGVALSGEIYDPLCAQQPALGRRFEAADFPVAAEFASRHICLPIFQGLTAADQSRIAGALAEELLAAERADDSDDFRQSTNDPTNDTTLTTRGP
jgi:dTDP-4-amino-4,6-dideoxygalactose transaminase/dienelactone hydrolase